METKKLIDCCEFISDGDHLPPPKSDSGVPFITISNITGQNKLSLEDTMFVPESYYNGLNENKKAQKGDILYSVVGSFGKPVYVDFDKQMVFQRHIAILRPKRNVNARFIYYTMLNPQFYKLVDKLAIGCSQRTVTLDTLRNIEISLPDKDIQDKTVEVLSLIDRKIDENCKINDNLEQQAYLIFENMMAKAEAHRLKGKYTEAKFLASVITGKEDANFSVPNGKYKFFTCSNKPLYCNSYAFHTSSILIAGNGDFNVKHYSGKFNAYQRTYVLTPKKEYFALLYFASLYRINSFKSSSSGSIVKFITKSDVENIPVFIPDDTAYLDELNKLLLAQEQNTLENELLVQLRDWLLPMLMNGQATISD